VVRLEELARTYEVPVFKGLVFAFPIFLTTIKSWHSGLFLVMVVYALLLARGEWRAADLAVRLFLGAVLLFLAVTALSLVGADDLYQGWKRWTKLSYFLGLFVLMLVSRRLPRGIHHHFTRGAVLGGFVLLGVALYQVFVLGNWRAQGITHPIIFGNVAMLLAVLIGVYLVYRDEQQPWLWPTLSMAACLGASFLSLSRGGWLVIPVLLVIGPCLFGRRLFARRILGPSVILVLCLTLVGLSFGDKLLERLDTSVHNIERFQQGEELGSSVGQRFVMWQIAIDMFRDSPILGKGLGSFKHESAVMVAAGNTSLIDHHSHAHSIYFEFLATTGLLGFVAMLMLVMVLPLGWFLAALKTAASDDQRWAAVSGIFVVICFAVYGVTESWLSRSPFIVVYCVTLWVFFQAIDRPAATRPLRA